MGRWAGTPALLWYRMTHDVSQKTPHMLYSIKDKHNTLSPPRTYVLLYRPYPIFLVGLYVTLMRFATGIKSVQRKSPAVRRAFIILTIVIGSTIVADIWRTCGRTCGCRRSGARGRWWVRPRRRPGGGESNGRRQRIRGWWRV